MAGWRTLLQRLYGKTRSAGNLPPRTGAYSHPGLVLTENEDSYLVVRPPAASVVLTAIADGLGGLEAGEIASMLALERLLRNHVACFESESAVSPLRARRLLRKAFLEANSALLHVNRELSAGVMMGTTLVAGIFSSAWAVVSHVGDSRCYRLRNGRLEQLTQDHTLVELMVSKGYLPREAAGRHPLSHVLSHCLGPRSHLPLSVSTHTCRLGDRFLLCSDGLSSFVPPEKIREILERAATPQVAARALVGRSLAAGAVDNITAVSVFY